MLLRKTLNSVVLPGEIVGDFDEAKQEVVSIGEGLRFERNQFVAELAGSLRLHAERGIYYVESRRTRYIPQRSDFVVGLIMDRHAEFYKVDIGAASLAVLDRLAFEGATKKNRPELAVGSLVYARVAVSGAGARSGRGPAETELTCVDESGRAGDFGALECSGAGNDAVAFCVDVRRRFCYALAAPARAPLLAELAAHVAFAVAVGLNGRVWLASSSARNARLVAAALRNAQHLDAADAAAHVALVRQLIAVDEGRHVAPPPLPPTPPPAATSNSTHQEDDNDDDDDDELEEEEQRAKPKSKRRRKRTKTKK